MYDTPRKTREIKLRLHWWEQVIDERAIVSTTHRNKLNDTGRANTLRSKQNGRHFPDDILKWNFD